MVEGEEAMDEEEATPAKTTQGGGSQVSTSKEKFSPSCSSELNTPKKILSKVEIEKRKPTSGSTKK